MIGRRLAAVTCAAGAILFVSFGCSRSGEMVDSPTGTQMSLLASPATGTTGEDVNFTVSASNPQTVLKAASIDFTDDGTWDDAETFDAMSIAASFTHAYATAGAFVIRAKVIDANNVTTFKSLQLIVQGATGRVVTYRVAGTSGITGGDCLAYGPPVGCAGCLTTIPAAGIVRSLGSVPQGSPVTVTQAFVQNHLVNGTLNTRYGCELVIDLYAGDPGNEVAFGHGACTTTSVDPESLTCSINVSGDVP